MSTQLHNAALLDLDPETVIELYEIDLGEEDGLYRFHPGKNDLKDVMLRDRHGVLQTYYAMPIEATNFEVRGDGQLPRPTLTIANPQGVITDAIKRRSDLVGNTIIRKRIFIKFLDHENFPDNLNPFGVPDPDSRFDDDIFKVNRKTQENKYFVEFELVSPLELEDVQIPARTMIANYCTWQYRGDGCFYGRRSDFISQKVKMADNNVVTPTSFFEKDNGLNLGIPLADANNKKFADENGYNLTMTWQGNFDKNTVAVTADGAATLSTVTINNASGYTDGATSMTVDSLPVAIANGKVITFTNGATFTLSSGASATATTLSGTLSGSVEDNETGTVAQSVSVDALSAAIDKDRTIVFSGGTTLKLDEDAASGATSISGLLSAALSDDQAGTTKYVAGDVVRIESKVENLAKVDTTDKQEDVLNRPDMFFVCIEEVATTKDPRYEQTYWRQDQCAKNLNGCKCRYLDYGKYRRGLPFGGFPSIEQYKF
jgi:lambda family phage minor tail protein L|tara:strand:- start:6673 stop:8133 length:1461 start_codon:yes stop_codon:yes gene_type:complete